MGESLSEPTMSLDEKLTILEERFEETSNFIQKLEDLKIKLEKKKSTIQVIIEKKIEENEKELKKWKDLLLTIVNESLDEKISSLEAQSEDIKTVHDEIGRVLEEAKNNQDEHEVDMYDSESEDPKLDDLLALDLKLQPEVLTNEETNEMVSVVKKDFDQLLNEPKKSLRRTLAYVAGILRGYLRRGKSNINWIKIMRKLEGREFEERFQGENDPYIAAKCIIDKEDFIEPVAESVRTTWNTVSQLYENRHNTEQSTLITQDLYKQYETNPEDVEFYLPQLCNLLLQSDYKSPALLEFILNKCSRSIHFALKTYLLIRANKDSREPPKKKKIIPPSIAKWRNQCDQLLDQVVKTVVIPAASPVLPAAAIQQDAQLAQSLVEHTSADIFQYPIQFMEELVKISKLLPQVSPARYTIELEKHLEMVNDQLQRLQTTQPSAFAFIPLLKAGADSAAYHKIVRIPPNEATPIPTYGRVLFYLWLEVVDIQVEHTTIPPQIPSTNHERDKKKEKKKKDKKENGNGSDSGHEPESEPQEEEPSMAKSSSGDKKKPKKGSQDDEPMESAGNKLPSQTRLAHSESQQLASSSGHIGSHRAFGELMERRSKRIQQLSPYGMYSTWRLQPLIVKYGDEVLQEEFAMQLMVQFQRIFQETACPVKLLVYRILAISAKSGLIEPVPNSLSLDKLKKTHTNLLNFFVQTFGEASEPTFKKAQQNFVRTMASNSIICYLLQIKDRHDGNMLMDASGHIIHIDYGYLLSRTIPFEKAPFKLTPEFVEVMGGYKSPCYNQFCRLCVKAFLAARKHFQKIVMLVEMTIEGKGKKVLPCLQGGSQVVQGLIERFHLDWTDEQCKQFILSLIDEARGSWRTIVYNAYQLILNNIH